MITTLPSFCLFVCPNTVTTIVRASYTEYVYGDGNVTFNWQDAESLCIHHQALLPPRTGTIPVVPLLAPLARKLDKITHKKLFVWSGTCTDSTNCGGWTFTMGHQATTSFISRDSSKMSNSYIVLCRQGKDGSRAWNFHMHHACTQRVRWVGI